MPFSLVPPHDMTRLIVENKNVAARGSDLDRSDVESDNVSKDSGGDAIHHDNTNNLTSLRSRSSNYNENEILILARAWVQGALILPLVLIKNQLISGIEF